MVGYRKQRIRKSILLTWEMLRSEKAENLISSFCTGGLTDSQMQIYKRVSKIALVKLKVAFLLIHFFFFSLYPYSGIFPLGCAELLFSDSKHDTNN